MESEKYLRVGIYLRLSNEDKDKDKCNKDISESIKNQRNLLLDYIDKNPSFVLFDEYCDEDLSGAGSFRPEFERLIRDCEHGMIDVVLCKSQSRFSRDMEVVERYINNKFKEWNIRFIGVSDSADTDNFGNKKSRQINGLVNEWYLEDVSLNIRSAFNSKMRQGEFISPFAPFGYEICSYDNNRLVVDKDASLVVKEIYNLYLSGFGFSAIASHLNEKGTPSPSFYKYKRGIKLNVVSNRSREDIKWNGAFIKGILTNEVYIGNLVQGKRTTVSYKNHKIINKSRDKWIRYDNTHEAIIDKDVFFKVQDLIKKRTRVYKKSNVCHVFSGRVYCKVCRGKMRKKNSSRHEYLVCVNSQKGLCENKQSIRYDDLKGLILNEINKRIDISFDKDFLKDEICKMVSKSNKISVLEKEKDDILKKISTFKNRFRSLYDDKVSGIIDDEYFKELFKFYKDEETGFFRRCLSIDEEISLLKNISYDDIIFKYRKFNALNITIVDEFIDKIFIGFFDRKNNTRDVVIKWNFGNYKKKRS